MSDRPKGTMRFRCNHGEQSYEMDLTPEEVIDSARSFLVAVAEHISNEAGIACGPPVLLHGTVTVGLPQSGGAALCITVNGLGLGIPLTIPQVVKLRAELEAALKHLTMMSADGTMTAH